MENKKSFGEFIQQKRKEQGLTQREFADKLYITESAVSKWERGLTYPDITIVKDICAVLHVSEHELMTASEDVQTRTNEKLAAKYKKLTMRFKVVQIVLYGIALLTCFIVNLAVSGTLSWFFIVLMSILTAGSLTLLPAFLQKMRGSITLLCFTVSLLLLLLICNIYTGGTWFFITSVSVIFGLCVVFLPLVLKSTGLPQPLGRHKALACMILDTALLFVVLLVANAFTGGGWFVSIALPITALGLLVPWAMLVVIRYTKLNGFFKAAISVAVVDAVYYLSTGLIPFIAEGKPLVFGYAFNFANWNNATINGNVNAITLFALAFIAIVFAVTGVIIEINKRKRV